MCKAGEEEVWFTAMDSRLGGQDRLLLVVAVAKKKVERFLKC